MTIFYFSFYREQFCAAIDFAGARVEALIFILVHFLTFALALALAL